MTVNHNKYVHVKASTVFHRAVYVCVCVCVLTLWWTVMRAVVGWCWSVCWCVGVWVTKGGMSQSSLQTHREMIGSCWSFSCWRPA